MAYNPLRDAVDILVESADFKEKMMAQTILEDATSPVTRGYQEKLYKSVIDRSHIDFSGIASSKGDITNFSGYSVMKDVLYNITKLAESQKSSNVMTYVDTVSTAINNIANLRREYSEGFRVKDNYIMMEYNTYVFTCVEATSAILYEFVEYIKRPDQQSVVITLKNTKFRADLFYFEQLAKFNKVNENMGLEYKKMLTQMANKSRNNFIGVETIVGVTALSAAALAIVPITRSLIYRFYKLGGDIASSLEQQAYFLEMNKVSVENNPLLTADKKKLIVERQKKLADKLNKIGSMLKVKNVNAARVSKRELESDNKLMSIGKIKDDISNSSLELL